MNKNPRQLLIFSLVLLLSTSVFFIYYRERITDILVSQDKLFLIIYNLKRITSMFNFSWNIFFMNIFLTLICFFIEILVIGWEKSTLKRILFKRDKSTCGDLWCWLLSISYLYNLFVLIFSFGVFYVITSILVKSLDFNIIIHIPSPLLQFIIIMFISDLKHYLRHIILHKVEWLWELHKYHHSAEQMNMITAQRGHFLEGGFTSIFDALLFVIFGSPVENYLGLILLREAHLMFTHSEVNWNWGWLGKYIFVSPAAHRIHHSCSNEHYDRNYGNMFIFWDRIFFTWLNPQKNKGEIKIGLTDNPFNKTNFFNDMINGYRSFLYKLFTKKKQAPVKSTVTSN